MTTASHKDLLLAKFQEYDAARQLMGKTQSEMHCIIGSLPEGTSIGIAPVIKRNRPVLVKASQSDVVAPTIETKPKRTRRPRTCEADIRKAVKLVFDEDLSQKEAEIACDIPTGSLSKGNGKQIMDGYRKEWGTPTRVAGQRGVRRKNVENANRYENR